MAQGCQPCKGVWLDNAAFGAVREHRYAAIVRAMGPRPPPTTRYGGGVISCPVCQAGMTKTKLADVALDHCSSHGTWFDRGELEAVASAISRAKASSITGARHSEPTPPPASGGINPETLARVEQLNAQLTVSVNRAETQYLMHRMRQMHLYR